MSLFATIAPPLSTACNDHRQMATIRRRTLSKELCRSAPQYERGDFFRTKRTLTYRRKREEDASPMPVGNAHDDDNAYKAQAR
jgi:hypothetical protein